MIVHLGVKDVAYSEGGKTVTTGQVAEWLEGKDYTGQTYEGKKRNTGYHVMRTFVELHEEEIGDELANQLMGLLESAKQGAPLQVGIITFPKIDAMFRNYLDSGEWERTSGQPTMAARMGVRHSHKHPYSNGKGPRPSFIDTGLYRASFTTWVND